MKISNIQTMRTFLYENSGFTKKTVNNIIKALGYTLRGSGSVFKELSGQFENCAEHGANVGFYSILGGDLENSEWGYISLSELTAIPSLNLNYLLVERSIEAALYTAYLDYFTKPQSLRK